MATIGEILQGEGCSKMGADFYFPPGQNPHLHIRVNNASRTVANISAIRPYVVMFLITNRGPGLANMNLRPPHAAGLRDRAGDIIRAWSATNRARAQRLINHLTGLGVDI
jgi:hypothetical protein